jgi:phage terminase large subunit
LILRPSVPRKLVPLLQPKRYKGAYGGRGGAKSHFFAEQVVFKALEGKRIVCIREVQNSIKDSVKQLLVDKIQTLGLEAEFDVVETEIRGPNGSLIVFKGMQSYNAANIKSLEGYDVAWVEEAQTFSQHSLDLLRPTLRKDGSELWFSWNPRYKTDPVDAFFRKSPPEEAISVQINWRDNPWFPEVLRKEMEHDFEIDPDKAEHIWNGAYGSSQGAILARLVNKAERDGRIHDGVKFDPSGAPILVSSDLGFRDTASWWYWQPVLGGFKLIKYQGESGWDADDWIPEIQQNLLSMGVSKDMLGKIWLPPDARAKTFQSKHTSVEKFLSAFGAGKVAVVPQTRKADQISAARTVIDRCEFNATECERGLDGLRAWEFDFNEDLQVFSKDPLHNWASHPGDAFAYGCQVVNEHIPAPTTEEKLKAISVGEAGLINVSLDELWELPKRGNRM